MIDRKQNIPKKCPNKGTGEGEISALSACKPGRYMIIGNVYITNMEVSWEWITTLEFCKCGEAKIICTYEYSS